jgi:hypothetical protein
MAKRGKFVTFFDPDYTIYPVERPNVFVNAQRSTTDDDVDVDTDIHDLSDPLAFGFAMVQHLIS